MLQDILRLNSNKTDKTEKGAIMTFYEWLNNDSLESKCCNNYLNKSKNKDEIYGITNFAYNGGIKTGEQQTIIKVIKILQNML